MQVNFILWNETFYSISLFKIPNLLHNSDCSVHVNKIPEINPEMLDVLNFEVDKIIKFEPFDTALRVLLNPYWEWLLTKRW